jgi:hypothetical protein
MFYQSNEHATIDMTFTVGCIIAGFLETDRDSTSLLVLG